MPGSHCAFTIGTYSDSLNKHLWRKADCFNVAIYFHWPAETELSIVWWILMHFGFGLLSPVVFHHFSKLPIPVIVFSALNTSLCFAGGNAYTLHKKSDQSEASKMRKQLEKNVKHQFEGSENEWKKNKFDWNGISQITHSITNLQRWA